MDAIDGYLLIPPDEVPWLIVGAPEQELTPEQRGDMSLFYPVDP
jgi:hypothetical protein